MNLATHSGTVLARALSLGLALTGCHEALAHEAPDDGSLPDSSLPESGPSDARVEVEGGGFVAGPSRSVGGLTFTPALQGDQVLVHVGRERGALYLLSCSGAITLEKRSGAGWAPLHDDRYASFDSPGYYLDDSYVAPSSNEGCDEVGCDQVGASIPIGLALEYVQRGTRSAPGGQVGAEDPARDVKTTPYTGTARVTLRYSLDSECRDTKTLALEFEVPSGTCCPVSASCSGANSGGWAPSDEQCDQRTFSDGYFTPAKDAHGCDVLHTSTGQGRMCCGCASTSAR